MADTKHTPGPWRYVLNPHGVDKLVTAEGFIVAKFDDAPSDHDASLIAAAPELLEVLQEIHQHAAGFIATGAAGDVFTAWDAKARAVIAKATGAAQP